MYTPKELIDVTTFEESLRRWPTSNREAEPVYVGTPRLDPATGIMIYDFVKVVPTSSVKDTDYKGEK